MTECAIDLPKPKHPSPNSAAAIQELLGGKFGEMSTLMNYTFQSFNFRGREEARPFYDLIANIAAEEYGHIETGRLHHQPAADRRDQARHRSRPRPRWRTRSTPATRYHFIASGQQALPVDSMGNPWTGQNVFSSGNLKLDLLHNFFLECGARANKIRVYEMVDDPTARAMVGYLLVRGGVHIVAYARALEKLTGADLGKLFPIPDISNKQFPEAPSWRSRGCTGSCTASARTTTAGLAKSGTARTRKMAPSWWWRTASPRAPRPRTSRPSRSSPRPASIPSS